MVRQQYWIGDGGPKGLLEYCMECSREALKKSFLLLISSHGKLEYAFLKHHIIYNEICPFQMKTWYNVQFIELCPYLENWHSNHFFNKSMIGCLRCK